jgi:3-dehydroquinate synthase
MLEKFTKLTILFQTRDGKLRAAVPSPLGSCVFLNDVEASEMNAALKKHKELMKSYPREGKGLEAFVDSSDTGFTRNGQVENNATNSASKSVINDDVQGGPQPASKKTAEKMASGPEGVNGVSNPTTNGATSLASGGECC